MTSGRRRTRASAAQDEHDRPAARPWNAARRRFARSFTRPRTRLRSLTVALTRSATFRARRGGPPQPAAAPGTEATDAASRSSARRNASTTSASNWMPAPASSSARAPAAPSAGR